MSDRTWPLMHGAARSLAIARIATMAAGHLLGWPVPASAQVIQTQVGSSTMYHAHGATVDVTGARSGVTIGVGDVQGGLQLTAKFTTRIRRATLTFGDETLSTNTPTDVANGSEQVNLRGGGVTWNTPRTRMVLLAGVTFAPFGAPFAKGTRMGRPIGVSLVDRQVNARLGLFSRVMIEQQPTAIAGAEWRPAPRLAILGGSGVSDGKPYASVAGRWALGALSGDLNLRSAAPGIQSLERLQRDSVSISNRVAIAVVRPSWTVRALQQRMIAALGDAGTRSIVMRQAESSFMSLGGRIEAGFYATRNGIDATGTSLGFRRSLRWSEVGSSAFVSTSGSDRTTSVTLSAHQALSSRLTVSQFLTTSSGRTVLRFGGRFVSNLATIDVGYDTQPAPFNGHTLFVQALGVHASVPVWRDGMLDFSTQRLPDGRARYTVSMRHIAYRAGTPGGHGSGSRTIGKYVVRGTVRDTLGRPVVGAALQVGTQWVRTGDDGCWFVRFQNDARRTLKVLLDDFDIPGAYAVERAPVEVAPVRDEHASDVVVELRQSFSASR